MRRCNSHVVTTARLRLRLWRDEDLEPGPALNGDPRVREFFPSVQTDQESADSMQSIRDHWHQRGFGLWALEVIGRAPFIGFSGLSVPSFDAPFMPCVELGYRLAFEHWGRLQGNLGVPRMSASPRSIHRDAKPHTRNTTGYAC